MSETPRDDDAVDEADDNDHSVADDADTSEVGEAGGFDGDAGGFDGDGDDFDDGDGFDGADDAGARAELRKTKARLEAEADRAVSEFDQGVVDLLAWILDTETRARIYVYLRQHPDSTSDEIADGTGLYPSTVREALAELHDEETVTRDKRESDGAGNNPYEYEAIAPSDLVRGVVGQVQRELNTVFNLEDRLPDEEETGPVTITIGDDDDDAAAADETADAGASDADDGAVTIEVEEPDDTADEMSGDESTDSDADTDAADADADAADGKHQ